jgi:hypothetical protein
MITTSAADKAGTPSASKVIQFPTDIINLSVIYGRAHPSASMAFLVEMQYCSADRGLKCVNGSPIGSSPMILCH